MTNLGRQSLSLRRRKKTVYRGKTLQVIKLQDVAIQTDHCCFAKNGMNDEMAEGDEVPVEDRDCSICLSPYNETTKMIVGKCGHLLCENCAKRLLDMSQMFKCPHCRTVTPKRSLITINQLSIYALAVPERKILIRKLEKAKRNLIDALDHEIICMIHAEQERADFLRIPARLSKDMICKKRSLLLATIASNDFRKRLNNIVSLAKKQAQFSSRFITHLKMPLTTFGADISRYAHEYLKNHLA